MATLTVYVCDCCGGQSTDLSKFAASPASCALSSSIVAVAQCLLCTTCGTKIALAGQNQWAALAGSNTGKSI